MSPWKLHHVAIAFAVVYAANALHYGWHPVVRTAADDVIAWAVAITFIFLYAIGYRSLAHTGVNPRRIVILALPLLLISFLTIPYDSTDAFQYMAMGWAQTHYGLNPYTGVLRDVAGVNNDPMLPAAWMASNKNPWLDLPLVYGPGFGLLLKTVARLSFEDWWWSLALLKLVNVAVYAAGAFFVWAAATRLRDPRPDRTLYLFAWSPLVLQHHIANAHNDLMVGVLIAGAVWLCLRGRGFWAPAILALAATIKYITLPLIPVALAYVAFTESRRRALLSAVAAALPPLVVTLPYLAPVRAYRFDLIASQLNKTTAGSLYAMFFYLYRWIARLATPLGTLEQFGTALKILLWAFAGGLIVREACRFARRRAEPEYLIQVFSMVLFAILFIGSSQFYSWYLGMILPVALMLGTKSRLRQVIVLLGGTHVLSLTSLSRKGIGYFCLTTGLAAVWLYRVRRPAGNPPAIFDREGKAESV